MKQKSPVNVLPYVLLSPAVLATLVVVFYPMVQAVITSLYNNILWKPRGVRFIGPVSYTHLDVYKRQAYHRYFSTPPGWTACAMTACRWRNASLRRACLISSMWSKG